MASDRVLRAVEAHATCGRVACAYCGARPGRPCLTAAHGEANFPHMVRVRQRLAELEAQS